MASSAARRRSGRCSRSDPLPSNDAELLHEIVEATQVGQLRRGNPGTEDGVASAVTKRCQREYDARSPANWTAVRLGYGNRGARAWFLGMEKACEDVMELPSRIAGGALEDLEGALSAVSCW